MKKILPALLLTSSFAFSQNLVPNPSFEIYTDCSFSQGDANYATGWFKSPVNNVPPSHADYMNSCNTAGYSVPSNPWGTEAAATGSGYMAITTKVPSLGVDYRENIYAQLTTALIPGQTYSLSFKLSLCDNFQYASDRMGLKFSKSPSISVNNSAHLFATTPVTLQTGWTTISGQFTADSAYTYVGLGNFFDDANTTEIISCSTCPQAYNIYYIDDLSVTQVITTDIPQSDLNQINFFPNPFNNRLDFSGLKGKTKIRILNSLGMDVLSTELDETNSQLDMVFHAAGVYFLILEQDNNRVIRKIIKE